MDLEALCWGEPPDRAPTLVLLHEGLGSAGLWREFPADISRATGWGVFAYSRQGYGSSPPCDMPRPVSYMTDEAVSVLPAVLEEVGVRRGVLFGHSDGASIAAIYAARIQEAPIEGLILMAPHFFVEDITLQSIKAARHAYENGDLRPRLARHHLDPDGAFYGWNDTWLSESFKNWSIETHLKDIRVPVLGLQGTDDAYGTCAQLHRLEQEVRSGCECHFLQGCGHAPHQEAPESVLSLVRGFAKTLTSKDQISVG